MRILFSVPSDEDESMQRHEVSDPPFIPRKGEAINLDNGKYVGEVTDIWNFYKNGKLDHIEVLLMKPLMPRQALTQGG